MMAKLAREIVYEIKPLAEVLEIFKISAADFERIKALDFFRRASEQFAIEWNSADSAEKRIRLQKLAALEDALPHLGALLTDPNVSPATKIEGAKFFSKELDAQTATGHTDKITINLNFGEDHKLQIDATPRTLDSGPENVQVDSEADRDAAPVRLLSKGS